MRRVEWSRGVAVMVLGFLLSLSLILLLVGFFLTPVYSLYLILSSFVFLFAVALNWTEGPCIGT